MSVRPEARCSTYLAADSNEWGRASGQEALILYSGKLPGGKRCFGLGEEEYSLTLLHPECGKGTLLDPEFVHPQCILKD